MTNEITGRILRLTKNSIHDGDGLRTVVFLKGCPLRCAWCASPESQDPAASASSVTDFSHGYGYTKTAEEVFQEITKDEIFYFHSGGGVTISGGEPLAQPEFTFEVLNKCKKMGINTAIETSAWGDYSVIEKLLPCLDVIYADLKIINEKHHIKQTGVSNKTILENIRRLAGQIADQTDQQSDPEFSGKLRIRIPLIPSINMEDHQIKAAAEFCNRLKNLDFVEFLPYHRLGIDTYRKLGREYLLSDIMPPSREYIEKAMDIFKETAPGVRIFANI